MVWVRVRLLSNAYTPLVSGGSMRNCNNDLIFVFLSATTCPFQRLSSKIAQASIAWSDTGVPCTEENDRLRCLMI